MALSARRVTPELVRFEVTDSGRGIAPQDMERIFEAFVQVSDGAGSRPHGVGLGLAISRELARAMGGDLTCSSDLGRGATFVFTAHLPVAAAPAEPEAQSRQRLLREGSGKTVVVVDDDPSSQLIATTVLRRLGCEVEEFRDAGSAMARLLRPTGRRPDLAIFDWDLPGIDGGEAARRLREHEHGQGLPRLPLVALSANASAMLTGEARDAGMDEVLLKPCAPEDLSAAILRQLRAETPAETPAEEARR